MAEDTKQFSSDSDSSEEPSGQSLPDLTRRLANSLQKPFHCQTCSKKFASKKSLNDHMRAHSGEKPFQCDICAKLFLRSGDLKRHLMMHSGEKPYQCEICQKQFPRKGNLQLHRITHTKARPHQCSLCGHYFAQKSGLTQHMLVHTGIKRFQCELCLKEFARKAYLQKHMLSHRNVPLDCEVCGKTFSASRNLKLHALSHISRRIYHCYMCEEVFSGKSAYFKHMNSHSKTLECQICFRQFTDLQCLREHAHYHDNEAETMVKEVAVSPDAELDEVHHMSEDIVIEMSVDAVDMDEHSSGHIVTVVDGASGRSVDNQDAEKELRRNEEHLAIHAAENGNAANGMSVNITKELQNSPSVEHRSKIHIIEIKALRKMSVNIHGSKLEEGS